MSHRPRLLLALLTLAFLVFAFISFPKGTKYIGSQVVQRTSLREYTLNVPLVGDDGKVRYEVKHVAVDIPNLEVSGVSETARPQTYDYIYWAIVIVSCLVYLLYAAIVFESWRSDRAARRSDKQATDTSGRINQIIAFTGGLILGFAALMTGRGPNPAELGLASEVRAVTAVLKKYQEFFEKDLDRLFEPRASAALEMKGIDAPDDNPQPVEAPAILPKSSPNAKSK